VWNALHTCSAHENDASARNATPKISSRKQVFWGELVMKVDEGVKRGECRRVGRGERERRKLINDRSDEHNSGAEAS
jgi:hypothetical protein